MTKRSKKKTPAPRVTEATAQTRKPHFKVTPEKTPPHQHPIIQWLIYALNFRGLLVAGLIAFGIYTGVTQNSGYRWIWQGYLKGNWNFIRQHSGASQEERLQMKLGFDYTFLNFIKKNTPDDAIILFPKDEYITEKSGNMQLTPNILSKMWATHFVYPRSVVYRSEAETNPLYNEVTHIAICAGHGYEDLDYAMEERAAFAVFPKHSINAE